MYNKLFTKILDSSIWLETTPTRIVWITLLAAMDQDGYAHFSAIGNLAARAGVSQEEAAAAVEALLSPDPNSANPANDGRRIERIPGGFVILNAREYANIRDEGTRKAYMRNYMAAKRDADPAYGRRGKHVVNLVKSGMLGLANTDTESVLSSLTSSRSSSLSVQIPGSGTEPEKNSGSRAHATPINGSGIMLETCKNECLWEVPLEKITEWEDAFPDVDVKGTLLGIRQWLRDNPRKRKTARGMQRFVSAWMMREQDKPQTVQRF